nr:MAG TPA: hypothetical protein [Caudoviricetes sp.]DAP13932.1 MAG TPA: hypothetical protein [Caudoviricetes sp.]
MFLFVIILRPLQKMRQRIKGQDLQPLFLFSFAFTKEKSFYNLE